MKPHLVASFFREAAYRNHRVAIVGERDGDPALREMGANPALETVLRFGDLGRHFGPALLAKRIRKCRRVACAAVVGFNNSTRTGSGGHMQRVPTVGERFTQLGNSSYLSRHPTLGIRPPFGRKSPLTGAA